MYPGSHGTHAVGPTGKVTIVLGRPPGDCRATESYWSHARPPAAGKLHVPLQAQAAKNGVKRANNIAYGPNERHRLDVYEPAQRPAQPMPVPIASYEAPLKSWYLWSRASGSGHDCLSWGSSISVPCSSSSPCWSMARAGRWCSCLAIEVRCSDIPFSDRLEFVAKDVGARFSSGRPKAPLLLHLCCELFKPSKMKSSARISI